MNKVRFASMQNLIIFIGVFFFVNGFSMHQKYTFELYELTLHPDNQYIFYNKEVSIRSIVAGDYHIKNDTLILTTHKANDEKAIFMMLSKSENDLILKQLYLQKEFISEKIELPSKFYLKATYYNNNHIFKQYIWHDKESFDYDIYSFSGNQNPLSLARYKNNLLEGEQVMFFNQREITPKILKYFKSGEKTNTWVYLEQANGRLLVYKTEKYKKGKLKKTKQFSNP